ncbi:MAG: hypothetical protein ACOC1F_14430 [Myxococcota bacterium]
MQFSHRNDPTRTATLSQRDDEPVFVVDHTDANGTRRSKSFKKPTGGGGLRRGVVCGADVGSHE